MEEDDFADEELGDDLLPEQYNFNVLFIKEVTLQDYTHVELWIKYPNFNFAHCPNF